MTTFNDIPRSGRFAGLVAWFDRLRDTVIVASEAGARLDEWERLRAMSDDDLAARGLSRDRLAQHVYRDLMHM